MLDQFGRRLTATDPDESGARSWKVVEPTLAPGPLAQQVIRGSVILTAPRQHMVLPQPR